VGAFPLSIPEEYEECLLKQKSNALLEDLA
jgi:hypothetical protein